MIYRGHQIRGSGDAELALEHVARHRHLARCLADELERRRADMPQAEVEETERRIAAHQADADQIARAVKAWREAQEQPRLVAAGGAL